MIVDNFAGVNDDTECALGDEQSIVQHKNENHMTLDIWSNQIDDFFAAHSSVRILASFLHMIPSLKEAKPERGPPVLFPCLQ